MASSSAAGARRIPIQASRPRQLIIYDSKTEVWAAVNDSTLQGKDKIIKSEYLAVSYRWSDFLDKTKLEEDIRSVCRTRGLNAYWLDSACIEDDEVKKNEDLYRMADVYRWAKETIIMIPHDDAEGWRRWGSRVWTFPEALLSRQLIKEVNEDGQKHYQKVNLRQVANLAYNDKEDEHKLVNLYGTSGKDSVRFISRFRMLCRAIWSRRIGADPSLAEVAQTSGFTDWLGERVYALMGFLSERIEPLLGESQEDAFSRLLDVNNLECEGYPWETDKEFNVWDKSDDRIRDDIPLKFVRAARYGDGECAVKAPCDENTRVQILETIQSWITSNSDMEGKNRIFWIHGLAGTGKSTIACSVAKACDKAGILAATFFCSRDSRECSNIQNIFSTLSYQLCRLYGPFKAKVLEETRMDKDLPQAQVGIQLEKLIVGPIEALKKTANVAKRYVIIIDALDECSDDKTDDTLTSRVLSALSERVADLAPFKFVITSRPEESIRKVFIDDIDLNKNTKAHNLADEEQTESDIRLYFRNRFRVIGGNARSGWPSEKKIDALVIKSAGLFIFASTTVKFLTDSSVRDSEGQLERLLNFDPPLSATSPYSHLDHLYLRILEEKFADAGAELINRLKKIFAVLLAALEPLTIDVLCDFLSGFNVLEILESLRSLVSIPENQDSNSAVRLIHPSIQDFLVDKERCTRRDFLIERPNNIITECCMKRLLLCAQGCNNARGLLDCVLSYFKHDSRKKNSVEYASYHIREHLQEFTVDDLLETEETAISFISDSRMVSLINTSSMADWAKKLLLEVIQKNSASLNQYVTSLYRIALSCFDVQLENERLQLESRHESFYESLLEVRKKLATVLPDIPTLKIRNDQFLHVEALLLVVQFYCGDALDVSVELDDVYCLLNGQKNLNEIKQLELSIIVPLFALELEVSLQLSLFYSFRGEDLERYSCNTVQVKWISVKQVWRRYRDLIRYLFDGDGHSLSGLYDAAFEGIKRKYGAANLGDNSFQIYQAVIWLGLLYNLNEPLLFFLLSSSSQHRNLLDFLSGLIFVFVRDSYPYPRITNLSDVDLLSYEEIPLSESLDRDKTCYIWPECTSYKQWLACHERQKNHLKYWGIKQKLILNHSLLIELAKEASSDSAIGRTPGNVALTMPSILAHFDRKDRKTEGKKLYAYENSFHSLMAPWCLLKVKVMLQGLDKRHYYHLSTGFPCIDLQSSSNVPNNDNVLDYALRKWHLHIYGCADVVDDYVLQLLQDILSNSSDLYYLTRHSLDRSDNVPEAVERAIRALSDRKPAVSKKLMQLLYENAQYLQLYYWIFGDNINAKIKLRVARRILCAKYPNSEGLYGFNPSFPQFILLAYRDGYMTNLEGLADPILEEKALDVRKLASEVHGLMLKWTMPKDKRTEAIIIRNLALLYSSLVSNRQVLYIDKDNLLEEQPFYVKCWILAAQTECWHFQIHDSNLGESEDSDSNMRNAIETFAERYTEEHGPGDALTKHFIISLAIEECSTALQIFLYRMNEIFGNINLNRGSRIEASSSASADSDDNALSMIRRHLRRFRRGDR